jgi:hypothetical protein
MWLMVCNARDRPALWAARGLMERGLRPFEIVTPEALAYSTRFEHRLIAGKPVCAASLPDGRVIESHRIRGVVNRMSFAPNAHLQSAIPADREYAMQELHATCLSWLYGLSSIVLNPPRPDMLSGDIRHTSEWRYLAAKAGLDTIPWSQSDEGTCDFTRLSGERLLVTVKDECCSEEAPEHVRSGCVRLASLAEVPVLGCRFRILPGEEWQFDDVNVLPDLNAGATRVLDALARALRQ